MAIATPTTYEKGKLYNLSLADLQPDPDQPPTPAEIQKRYCIAFAKKQFQEIVYNVSVQENLFEELLASYQPGADNREMLLFLTIPGISSCKFDIPGERRFARLLEVKLEDDYLCWYNVPIGPSRLHPDFIIMHPKSGTAIPGRITVKHAVS